MNLEKRIAQLEEVMEAATATPHVRKVLLVTANTREEVEALRSLPDEPPDHRQYPRGPFTFETESIDARSYLASRGVTLPPAENAPG